MKNEQKGFSLVEVLVSLIMVAITMTSLLALQSALQKMLFNDNVQWKAEQYAYAIFAENQKKDDIKPGYSSEHEQDGFTAAYSFSAFKEDSPLAKIKHLYAEKVVVTWTRLLQKNSCTFIRYLYKPYPEKDGKAPEVGQQDGEQPEIKKPDGKEPKVNQTEVKQSGVKLAEEALLLKAGA